MKAFPTNNSEAARSRTPFMWLALSTEASPSVAHKRLFAAPGRDLRPSGKAPSLSPADAAR
jgi:hypothetical protein